MGSHPNAEVQRALFDAVVREDMSKVTELLAEDLVVHLPGNNAVSGTYKGRDEFFKLMQRIEEITGGLQRELHDIVASDDHSVALIRLTVERDGKRLTWGGANVVHIRNGKIAELWFLADDFDAMNLAYS